MRDLIFYADDGADDNLPNPFDSEVGAVVLIS